MSLANFLNSIVVAGFLSLMLFHILKKKFEKLKLVGKTTVRYYSLLFKFQNADLGDYISD